ncbi:hypothetical protein BJY04DRAFT_217615 [Aspergillus karnatakaensis]|uniref:ATP-binding protein n=1 Tax=Aspergillus karnatakaensis TaxID=1810916 RepID=UPI003CCCFDBC
MDAPAAASSDADLQETSHEACQCRKAAAPEAAPENGVAAEPQIPNSQDAPVNQTTSPDSGNSAPNSNKMAKVIGVRETDWEHFKNRYAEDEGLEIIEVLRGHQHLAREVSEEKARRAPLEKREAESLTLAEDQIWIQRVRIQSPAILLLLSRLSGHRDSWLIHLPRVFFRPFRAFHYFLADMQRCLGILESRWARAEADGDDEQADAADNQPRPQAGPWPRDHHRGSYEHNTESDSDDEDKSRRMGPVAAVDGHIADSVTALRHVRRFVQFVENKITPLWKRAVTQRKVRFADLWMSFRPGELLYVAPSDFPQSSETRKPSTVKMYQSAWRLYSMASPGNKDDCAEDIEGNSKRELWLGAYYIDYDGESYGPVRHSFFIKDYEGEKDITTFDVYPLRFVKDPKVTEARLRDQGQKFQKLMREKHLYHDGGTLAHGPTGHPDSDARIAPEHIESDVIVDFDEGYKADSKLKPPEFEELGNFSDSNWPSGGDQPNIRHWTDESRSALLGEIREITQLNEWYADFLIGQHRKESKFIQTWEEKDVTQLDDEDLVLLPSRVVAYAFRERKFVMVDIEKLKKIPAPQNVFQDLKIEEQHKRLLKSLVKSHFKRQDAQRRQPSNEINQDLIRGKGTGLVILLHGVPGVGKTTTAEAVAQAHEKPLFFITCGDLGFTPREIEASLREIFRLAHLWDCVLLLDEADVFLTRRNEQDLKRNAIVSVFLRVLEYYSGILFLTTNRMGSLDEAFKSRIHVSLYYPPLSLEHTLAIFKVNIRRLRDIEHEMRRGHTDTEPRLDIDYKSILDYAEWHYKSHERNPEQRWNGRQIRNAFQVACSLAQFDMNMTSHENWDEDGHDARHKEGGPVEKNRQLTSKLDYAQFKIVADMIEKFDEYLCDTLGNKTASDEARTHRLRADDHTSERGQHRPA